MAYNPMFGGTLNDGNDYFRLSAVTGTTKPPGKVPEPGTALLLGAVAIGGFWLKRRSKRA